MRTSKLVVTTVAVGLLLAACGADPDQVAGEDPEGAEQSPAAEEESDGATAAEEESDAATGTAGETRTLTVAQATATTQAGSGLPTVMSAGLQHGFFDEHNIDLELTHNNGSTAAIQAVASRSADLGFADLGAAFQAHSYGVPIKMIGSVVINFPWKMATLPDSDIRSPEDLEGRTIGIISQASASYSYAQNYLLLAGLSEDDVDLLPVGIGPGAGEALRSGEVDVLAHYEILYAQLEQQGFEFDYLDNFPLFDNLVSIGVIARDDVIDELEDELAGFLQGLFASTVYTIEDPEAAVLDSFAQFPEWLSGSSEEELLGPSTTSVTTFMESINPPDHDHRTFDRWGEVTEEQWEATTEYELNRGGITEPIPMGELYDGRFIERANAFDRDAVLSLLN